MLCVRGGVAIELPSRLPGSTLRNHRRVGRVFSLDEAASQTRRHLADYVKGACPSTHEEAIRDLLQESSQSSKSSTSWNAWIEIDFPAA